VLVDASWQPPDPDPERRRPFRWPPAAWPVLTVLFLVAGYVTPPFIGYLCLLGAIWAAVECFALLVPRAGGLKDYKQ
jgi:hypothetical protein